ncbi:MAG: GTPase ObgE [Desulfobacterales bacterium]|nr:GTPase ObgE [Desulfobacterales bacterium]
MKFVDEALINVRSGDGGNGCVSFRREKHVPKGGPDGGDGGKGGDVIFQATSRMHTLYSFQLKKHFKAQKGAHGRGKNRSGRQGKDVIILVPQGTLIREAETGRTLKDLAVSGESFVAVRGGRGGRGNQHFASSRNQTFRHAEKGEAGQDLSLKLELKLLTDVGIIGLPNAGKSTLISKLSSAHPKIADYPFTTLTPILGVVEPENADPFVIADIPGLIEGAHRGVGLGMRFLKHVERSRLLLHLIDLSALPPEDPLRPYHTVNRELRMFNPGLAEKSQVVVLNKVDAPGAGVLADKARKSLEPINPDIWVISALTGQGLEPLKGHLAELVEEAVALEVECLIKHDQKTGTDQDPKRFV